MLCIVCHSGQILGNFAEGAVHSLKAGGNTSGGTQMSDILLYHTGGKCQLSPQKSFLSFYEIICPLSRFNTLFC